MTLHFKAATATVPIVACTGDPIAFGISASLAWPGGNIAGVLAGGGNEIWDKVLEFLREVVPTASKVALSGATMARTLSTLIRSAASRASTSVSQSQRGRHELRQGGREGRRSRYT